MWDNVKSFWSRLKIYLEFCFERRKWKKIGKKINHCDICGEDVSKTWAVVAYDKTNYPFRARCWKCYERHGLG